MAVKTDLRATVEVPLQFPVTIDAREYKALKMRRPRTRDVLAARKYSSDEMERAVFVMARLCDVSPDVIEELDEFDTDTLADQLGRFRLR